MILPQRCVGRQRAADDPLADGVGDAICCCRVIVGDDRLSIVKRGALAGCVG
jgi:hypothetical protein